MNEKATRLLFAAVALSALAAVLASTANARIPEGSGTTPTSPAVVDEQSSQASGTFFVDPAIYAALTSLTVADEQRASMASVPLDPAIKTAIEARSHTAPLAAQPIRTGTGRQQVAQAFPYLSSLGSKAQVGRTRHEKSARLPHGIQVGLP